MTKKSLPWMGIALVLGAISLSVVFVSSDPSTTAIAKPTADALPVIVSAARASNTDQRIDSVGTAKARQSVTLYSPVSEVVTGVSFNASRAVAKEALLIQLDDREERLALELARVRLNDAQSLLKRYEQAVKEGGVPESEVDAARATYASAKIAVSQAQLALSERAIRAPFAGFTGLPQVMVGDRVTPTTVITTLDARQQLDIEIDIPEALAAALAEAIRQKQRVLVSTPAYPDQRFTGVLLAQASRVDSNRRSLVARIGIDNSKDLLRPGMSFTVQWQVPGQSALSVPEIALQWSREGAHIWQVTGDIVNQVPVTLLTRRAGEVIIDAPIKPGDLVVVEGLQRLKPGASVAIIGAPTATAKSPRTLP